MSQPRFASTEVPGLYVLNDFLTLAQEQALDEAISGEEWEFNRSGTRRCQVYKPWDYAEDHRIVAKEPNQRKDLPEYLLETLTRMVDEARTHLPEVTISFIPFTFLFDLFFSLVLIISFLGMNTR